MSVPSVMISVDVTDKPLTIERLTHLSALFLAITQGKRVRWVGAYRGNEPVITDGVLRRFVANTGGAFLRSDEDVRHALVRISGTFEYFIPVEDVLALMAKGEFAID